MFKLTIMSINLHRNWNELHFLFRYFGATRTEVGLPDFPVGLPVGYHPIFVKFERDTCTLSIDILNKDCRRSISAILTSVLENVKISVRPLNSIGN